MAETITKIGTFCFQNPTNTIITIIVLAFVLAIVLGITKRK
nr:hypothetical protein [Enterocloster clostridioformis]